MSRSKKKAKPPSTVLPAGWTALAAAAKTESEQSLLAELLDRNCQAELPAATIADLGALLRGLEEVSALATLVGRIRQQQSPAAGGALTAYERHKLRTRGRQARISAAGREVGPLPPIRDLERRIACERDLKLALKTYWPASFPLDFSPNHEILIARGQLAVLTGSLFAVAMPRGEGKTVSLRHTAEWAITNGHVPYVFLVNSTEEGGEESIEFILVDLETNPLLLEDFPEVVFPLQVLDGIHNRAKGQLLDGKRTRVQFRKRKLVLPTIEGSSSSGAVIRAAGIMSAMRGANHRRADGTVIRPRLILPDDVQTRESAESPQQNATRIRILTADILGMAGPGEKIAALGAFTVIAPGDVADTVLDHEKHPEWHGLRTSMLGSFPERMDLWEEYWDIFTTELRAQLARAACELSAEEKWFVPPKATKFYTKHRKEMDRGAKVGWEQRHRSDELSALQHAMNLYFRDEGAFFSEYQNDPKDPFSDEEFLTAKEVSSKVNNYERGQVPVGVEWLVFQIDCHKRVLSWVVCGFEWDFTGYLLDYGAFPEQARPNWRAGRARPTLQQTFPRLGDAGALYRGIAQLGAELLGKHYRCEDGTERQSAGGLIDMRYMDETVKRVVREQGWLSQLYPAYGKEFGPRETVIAQYKRRAGELIGENWILKRNRGGKQRSVMFSTGDWKTLAQRGLATAFGNAGCFSIFGFEPAAGKGRPRRKANHDWLAQHLTAETRTVLMEGDRRIDQWRKKPGSENHWLDGLVGCFVRASMCGARYSGAKPAEQKRKFGSLSQRRAGKRRG